MKWLTEWLLPPARFARDDVPRFASSLLLVGFGFACAAACAYFGITEMRYSNGALGGFYFGAAVGSLVCVIGYRHSASLVIWGNLFIGILFTVAAIANLGTGGRVQGVNMVLPTLVIVAALMLDRRSAIVWSALTLIQIGLATMFSTWPIEQFPLRIDQQWDATAYQRVPLVMTVLSIFLAIWFKLMMGRIQQHLLDMHRRERDARSESERLNRMLAEMAAVDPLTGLLNRRALHEVIANRDAAAEHWLLYVDLDGFKAINDSLGHEAGDRVLVEVAALFRGSGADIVARLGGDEFCLLVTGGEFRARQIAERIVQSVAGLVTGGPTSPRIGASIGIARASGASVEAAMRAADAACYRAKHAGKGQYVLSLERSA
jgi:diguanylate cyclase (GGDEF)-like protein